MTGDGDDEAAAPSAEERAADAAIYQRLADVGFVGPEFTELATVLAGYAYPILLAWVTTGKIFTEMARRGVCLGRGAPRVTPSDVEDLVQETILSALTRFAARCRTGRGWSPTGGASLASYFTTTCVLAFADVYRDWTRAEWHQRQAAMEMAAAPAVLPSPDPADVVSARDAVQRALPADQETRVAVVLTAAGYTQPEIAEVTGTTPKALESRLYRRRKKNAEGGTAR